MIIDICSKCSAPFNAEVLKKALINGDKFITCPSCGEITELINLTGSSTKLGYERLINADFSDAISYFQLNISDKKGTPDDYLGLALANFSVQTIFYDNDRFKLPMLICHDINRSYFADNANYKKALDMIPDGLSDEKLRLQKIAEYIDSVKDYYDEISKSQERYNVFIAYCDKSNNNTLDYKDYQNANRISNWFPTSEYSVFKPEPPINDSGLVDDNNAEYEAWILYAIEHSKSMIVDVNGSMNTRLRSMYLRFYNKNKSDSSICFVSDSGNMNIIMPDNSKAKNCFAFNDYMTIKGFVAKSNNRLVEGHIIEQDLDDETPIQSVENVEEEEYIVKEDSLLPQKVDFDSVVFGEYPQREEKAADVLDFFESLGRPTRDDSKGWTVMYYDGMKPYMWYIDRVFKGKKYRGVYFIKLRKGFTLHNNSNVFVQRNNRYASTQTLYCFEFQPIRWNISQITQDWSCLIAETALECREFNDESLSNDYSTIPDWLNEEFLPTAFNNEQISWLHYKSKDGVSRKVNIPDVNEDKSFWENGCPMGISDYFKCVGGGVESSGALKYYWVSDSSLNSGGSAKAVDHSAKKTLLRDVDCSMVAVLPKIYIKF